ncbi:bifunctional enoyl-CoA hydratase/phosphate acetyltransferase [Neptuniibacter sp. QD37_11]|uniref:bifunctional enoyl-CoA hydratase/phosphate acetyltransferase n=1 Tax=Neptuniibacter sp. QD37_11 TaxID=3398209 RepID=UPI0039F62708
MSDITLSRTNALDHAIEIAAAETKITMAVAHPADFNSLSGAVDAAKNNIIEPILVGPASRIMRLADEHDIDLTDIKIVDSLHSHESAAIATGMARTGEVQSLMKGSLGSSEILSAIFSRSEGLRTERRMSHIFALDCAEHYHKPLFVTDAAINVTPDLNAKRDITQNAINFCQCMGIETPKVAVLAAVEKVKASMVSTLDAAALCKMADRKQITGGELDGPLAFDNAICRQAAIDKGIASNVAGDADILLAPDLEAGNMIAKQQIYMANAKSAGLVLGAKVPVVLTSRADNAYSRMASAALAALVAHHQVK